MLIRSERSLDTLGTYYRVLRNVSKTTSEPIGEWFRETRWVFPYGVKHISNPPSDTFLTHPHSSSHQYTIISQILMYTRIFVYNTMRIYKCLPHRILRFPLRCMNVYLRSPIVTSSCYGYICKQHPIYMLINTNLYLI